MTKTAVLRIDCPGRKGLVPAVVSMLYGHGANVTHADQHQDHEAGLFFMPSNGRSTASTLAAFPPRQDARRRAAQHLRATWLTSGHLGRILVR